MSTMNKKNLDCNAVTELFYKFHAKIPDIYFLMYCM